MAVPATVDEFLDLVRKSGVADEKRLDAYLAKLRADMPADAPKAAGLLVHNGILTNFQAENILAGKWRRFSIGKYKVLERLGSGGFAQVYLCEHKLMRRRVAVKVLPIAKAKDGSALERFIREAQAVAKLDHPNIVQAFDIDQDDDLHFLVMEYVDGANLQEIIKRSGPLSVLRACHYIRNSALALQHAYEHGLIHRDIKPGNILVDRAGVVKVLDMGLAFFFQDEEDQLTKKHDDGTLGTADYLSPEQAMDSHDVDIRTDIYSLGVTFYFLLTGRAPFEGVPIAQKLLAHQMKQPKPVTDYRKDVPAGVLAVLEKMMAKKADQRFAEPGDVADALAPFTQTPIGPPPEAEMPKLSPLASGQAIASEAETTTGRTENTPVAPPRTPPSSGSDKKAPPAPPPSSGSNKPKPAPPPAAAPVPVEPAAPAEEPFEPFATDTAPKSGRTEGRAKKAAIASTSNPIVLGVLIAAFVIVPIVLTAVVFGVIVIFFPTVPVTKAALPKLEVSRDPNRTGCFADIRSALKKAESGSVIELTDETYEENVVIDRGNVTLQAAPGTKILWKSAKSDPTLAILIVRNVADFKLKGSGITFDGSLPDKKGQVNDLIRITEGCPDLLVENTHCKNFARSAVYLLNAAGKEGRPIKLQRLTTETKDKTRAAIYFDANPNLQSFPINDHIEISDDCDFRGHDKAFQLKSDKVNTNNVRWPGK